MSDYNVYVTFLDKAIDIEKKNRKHIFGIVKAVGNTALLLENIVLENGSDDDSGKVYYRKGEDVDLYKLITESKTPSQTVNYENIWACKPVLSKEEKIKRYGLPEDTDEQP